MKVEFEDRRSGDGSRLRPGALRCEDCGTTWFDQHPQLAVSAGRCCRRCGGRLHTERRQPAVVKAAVVRAA